MTPFSYVLDSEDAWVEFYAERFWAAIARCRRAKQGQASTEGELNE